jgi:hypothetical protein
MTSNLKRTLGGVLTLAVVFSAAEARAQSLEKPGAPPSDAAAAATVSAASGPAAFGDSGQFVLSAEQLFGYSYSRTSFPGGHNSTNTFSLLADPGGSGAAGYIWPRLGFDYFVAKGFSLGGAASFYRSTPPTGNVTAFELAPRVGYDIVVGPWLSAWPRLGFTYVHASSVQYSAVSLDVPLVIAVTQHFAVLVTPTLDYGVSGSHSIKITDAGLSFGLAMTF